MIELRREGFINQYPPLNILNKNELEGLYRKKELHLYVHIPFCKVKCDFCYYYSLPIGKGAVPDAYVDALIKEIELYSIMPQIQAMKIRSIYFGGGTPTLLSKEQISRIIREIYCRFDVMEHVEFCFETGPDLSEGAETLELLKELGINRVSIGCQSTDENVLRKNGRYRTVEQFYKKYEILKNIGFTSINIDVMSGLIGQSAESFMKTLEDVIRLRPQNISVYKLEVYLNNQLYKKVRSGEIELCSDTEEIKQVRQGYQFLLDNGYQFALHFSFYTDKMYDHVQRREAWKGADMLGIGVSSHSNVSGSLYQNESDIKRYISIVNDEKLPVKRCHIMNGEDRITQYIVLGLKNMSISRREFAEKFGVDLYGLYKGEFDELKQCGLITITQEELRMTLEGALFADDIAKMFFLPQYKKMSLAHIQRQKQSVSDMV